MRGKPTKTPERVAEAARMRAAGRSLREVAEHLGINVKTVSDWVVDPDRAKAKARRDSYRGACVDCGKPTDGSDGPGRAKERCVPCTARHRATWSREHIIEAVRSWVEQHGTTPTAVDWNPSMAVRLGHPEKAERFYADDAWPLVATVQDYFGSFNAAIEAAGFQPRRPGVWETTELRKRVQPKDVDEMVEMYAAGCSMPVIGRYLGFHARTVGDHLRRRGVEIRDAPAAVRLALAELREAA